MKKNLPLSILTLAISAAISAHSIALENENKKSVKTQLHEVKEAEEIEVIEVRGIKNSIKESLFLKRNSVSVVDAVVADDIGKFPDENLAEALQRIPGITITRNGGEGQNILVRGLGGTYNVTTVNGRKLASENTGRDFNYDTIASELVSVLKVYKSPEARLIEGGIGAIIDIETRKPLDLEGFTLSTSAKGIYESRTEDIHPHASFIIGDKFNDETFGALFSAVYSKKTLRSDTYSAGGFFDENEGWGADSAGVPVDANNNGVIDDSSEIFASKIPSYMYFANAQDVRERIGATLALQWRPTEQLDINFDTIYSQYNTDGHRYQIGFVNYDESWTPGTPLFTNAKFDDLNRVVAMKQSGDNTMVELLNLTQPRKTDTYQVGLNVQYQFNDEWDITFDIAHSEAKNKNSGDNRFIVARGFVDEINIDYDRGNILPDVVIEPGLTSEQQYGAHYSRNTGTNVDDQVTDVKLFANYMPDDSIIDNMQFGIQHVRQKKSQLDYRSKNPGQFSRGGFYLNRDGYDFDDSTVFTRGEFELFGIPNNVFIPANFDNFLDGEDSISPQPWPSFDYDELLTYFRSINEEATNKSIVASENRPGTYSVEEAVTSAYVQVNIVDDLADMPYFLNIGLRISRTDLTSGGYFASIGDFGFDSDGKADPSWRDKVTLAAKENSYTDVLPSINFKLNITDELIYRFSAAEVVSRPKLADLKIYSSAGNPRESLSQITMGNPNLKPERANQYDMTLEWYFADSSSASAGVFYKDIKTYITDYSGALNIDGNNYYVNTPINGDGAKIQGFEVAYSQSLDELLPEPFNGLGFQLNYTYVDSSYEDEELKKSGLPFKGMSENSYNAVVYYENYGFQARLAYNWRSEFLVNPKAWGGPSWVSDYGQLDASMSYEINKTLIVFAEASNLMNKRYWGYVKRADQVNKLERFGTQIAIGVRASF